MLHWGCLKKQVGIQRSARANVFLARRTNGARGVAVRPQDLAVYGWESSHHPGAGFREWEHAWEDADMPHLKMLSVSFMSVAGQLQISEAIKSEASAVVELHCLAWHSAQVVWQKDWQRLWRTGWLAGKIVTLSGAHGSCLDANCQAHQVTPSFVGNLQPDKYSVCLDQLYWIVTRNEKGSTFITLKFNF